MALFRRFVAATAALTVLLGTAACAGDSGAGDGRKKIAFLLPDVTATRYDRFDVPYFADKVEKLCQECEVIYRNAAQLTRTQEFQAEEALENGADVLVLDPVDGKAAGNIVKLAKSREVPVISYDRLIENADVDYYISFDNEKVGKLQASALVQKLQKSGITSGRIVMINGSKTDNNAMQYNKGARSILDQSGFDLVPEPQFFTPEWDPAKAEAFMADLLPKLRVPATGGKPASLGFVGVYAANDGTAGGAINAMAAAGIKQFPPVTGQDAEIQAIQRILAGEQYMTVYKSYRPEAERAAEFAVALVNGQIPKATATVNNGFKDVPSLLLDPTMITRENVRSAIVDAGLYTTDELCVQRYVPGCQTAGLG